MTLGIETNTLIFVLGVAAILAKTFHDHKEICRRLRKVETKLGIE